MKYLRLLVIFFALSGPAFGQTTNELLGRWNVVKINIPDEIRRNDKEAVKELTAAFSKMKFEMKQGSVFNVESPVEELSITNGEWSYNAKEKSVLVTGSKSNAKKAPLMKFFVEKRDGKWFFRIDDSPFLLELEVVRVN